MREVCLHPADQITGENIGSNATVYWSKVVQPCVITSTRWATIFGNHGELKPVFLKCVTCSCMFSVLRLSHFFSHSDDLSASGGTRKDLLSVDTKYTLSYSQFGPVSDHMTIT